MKTKITALPEHEFTALQNEARDLDRQLQIKCTGQNVHKIANIRTKLLAIIHCKLEHAEHILRIAKNALEEARKFLSSCRKTSSATLYLNDEINRKYTVEKPTSRKLNIIIDPRSKGRLIYLEDGVWFVEPELISKVKEDVLFALGIKKNSKEEQQIKHRVIINPNRVIIEFLLYDDIK